MNKIPLLISKLIPSNIRLIKYHKQSDDVCYGVSENAFVVIANSCVNIYKFNEMTNITKLRCCIQFDYFNFRHEYSISDQSILSSFPNKNPPSSILEFERDELLLANSALTVANNEVSAINRSLKLSNDVLIADKVELTTANRKLTTESGKLTASNLELIAANGKLTTANNSLTAEVSKLTKELAVKSSELASKTRELVSKSSELVSKSDELATLKKLHSPDLFKQVKSSGVSEKVLDELIKEIKTIIINNLE